MEKKASQPHAFHLIDGKALEEKILLETRRQVVASGRTPGLAVILVGTDAPSQQYIRNKKRACEKVGIDFHLYRFNEGAHRATEQEIIDAIQFLNNDPTISGIIVQLPLPDGYNTGAVIRAISPAKDADGFHPDNVEKILAGTRAVLPPLIKSLIVILESQNIPLAGKNVVIVGKSDVFNAVMKKAFSGLGAEVVRVGIKDPHLRKVLKSADVVIPMAGQPEFLTGDMLKPGVAVIDVGVTKTPDGYKGDADIESIKKVASCATPTPGGVGPVTVAMLLDSVITLAQAQAQ